MSDTKLFCTKYWETGGIMELSYEPSHIDGYVRVKHGKEEWFCRLGKNAFFRREDAEKSYLAKIQRKILSLRKKIAKLEALATKRSQL